MEENNENDCGQTLRRRSTRLCVQKQTSLSTKVVKDEKLKPKPILKADSKTKPKVIPKSKGIVKPKVVVTPAKTSKQNVKMNKKVVKKKELEVEDTHINCSSLEASSDATIFSASSNESESSDNEISDNESESDYDAELEFKKKKTVKISLNSTKRRFTNSKPKSPAVVNPEGISILKNVNNKKSKTVSINLPSDKSSSAKTSAFWMEKAKAKKEPAFLVNVPTDYLKQYLINSQKKKNNKSGKSAKDEIFDEVKKETVEIKPKPQAKPKREHSSSSSSDDDCDDWVEMEKIDDLVEAPDVGKAVQVTIKRPKTEQVKTVETEWVKFENYVRLEIARRRREYFEDLHKTHILCYIAHLRFYVSAVIEKQSELGTFLADILPSEILSFCSSAMDTAVCAFRKVFRFCSQLEAEKSFAKLQKACSNKNDDRDNQSCLNGQKVFRSRADYINYLKQLISCRLFTSDRDLAVLEPTEEDLQNAAKEQNQMHKTAEKKKLNGKSKIKKNESPSKLLEKSKHQAKGIAKKRKSSSHKTSSTENSDIEDNFLEPRNYWVEFYDDEFRRWIYKPNEIEKHASLPMLYVIVVDNEMGVRELCAKYSSEYLTCKFRRLRVDNDWLETTLNKNLLRADIGRTCAENVQLRDYLLSLPKPIVVSEFKNHPLYVLEKDLLKFEAIYPPETEPLGCIRNHKIFPRNAVYTLQGDLNWLRLARSVKKGEKPYKIVKARPKLNIPKEERVQLYLDVYGFWQTEQFVSPPVVNGKIPRNEHGNIYMYQKTMAPKDCVYLRLNGLYQIARRMDLEAVQAVIGWEFSGGKNHPIIDGCVVLSKDAEVLKKTWRETMDQKAIKEAQKAEERVWLNWRRLIKGKLLLEKMRVRFN